MYCSSLCITASVVSVSTVLDRGPAVQPCRPVRTGQ